MHGPFASSLREALQCSFVLLLVLSHPAARNGIRPLLAGALSAFAAGYAMGYLPEAGGYPWTNEAWAFLRYVFELSAFYLALVFLKPRYDRPPQGLLGPALFVAGFFSFFFEARALGFYVRDIGLIKEAVDLSVVLSISASALGFVPLAFHRRILKRLPTEKAMTLPALLVLASAFKFLFGGVGEVEDGDILISLQRGIGAFLENAVTHAQKLFLVTGHPFIKTPLAGLAGFLSGNRASMALVVLLITAPPVLLLLSLVSRPDPDVSGIDLAAQRRLRLAFFRKETAFKAAPVIVSLLLVLVSLHAVNVSLNPLSEPVPITVREAEHEPGVLRIPLSDKLGDYTDGKLRKYVYYYGNMQIIFLAIMKPDGTLGVALDECEVCKPAEWNKAAQGYAQRGDHLVCKYCMTPIPVPTVNKPGGCNPIPLDFKAGDGEIIISLDDLIRVFKGAKEPE